MAPVLKVNGRPWWKPRKKSRRRKNPSSIKHAADFYEKFHWGEQPSKVVETPVLEVPDVLTELGTLVAVTYETRKGGEKAQWEHMFGEDGGKRPKLAADPNTMQLHIVGGDYTITAHGIED